MKEAKKPDLNAPRFRRNLEGTLNNNFLKELYENVPSAKHLSKKEIKKIIVTFNKNIWLKVIDERDGVELPESIGHIFLGTCPPKKRTKNVDFKMSADYQKVIQHRNWESDKHLAKIFYTTFGTKYRFKFHDLWAFNGTRNFTRKVGETYPTNWKRYIEIPPILKISNLYKNNVESFKKQEETKALLESYNEFEI